MKLLILSDSHGSVRYMEKAIDIEKPDAVIYLGDGIGDFLEICDNYSCLSYIVEGNCDFESYGFAENLVLEFGGKRFYVTHGANEHVKAGLMKLALEAEQADCDVALFGHTHRQYANVLKDDGRKEIILFNPGTAYYGYYGIINVNDGNISYEHKSL